MTSQEDQQEQMRHAQEQDKDQVAATKAVRVAWEQRNITEPTHIPK